MEMTTHAVAWAEIPVTDFDRAKKFYSAIFDFDMPEMEMAPHRMGFLLSDMENGGVGAAIVKGPDYVPTTKGCKVYLSGGSDLNTVLNRVAAAGGKVLQEKTIITPEFGFYATFADTEGNHVSLHSMA